MKIQDSKLKAISRHTIMLANDIVSIILTLLPLIFAPLLLPYTTRLQPFRWKPVERWALAVPICRPPVSQKLSSGGYVENSNAWGLVSAFRTQTWVETTTIKAECGRREAGQSKIPCPWLANTIQHRYTHLLVLFLFSSCSSPRLRLSIIRVYG